MPCRRMVPFLNSLAMIVCSFVAPFLSSCRGGGYNGNAGGGNPIPAITSLAPNSTTAGGPAFTLTVTGTNFISSSSVQWNGSARATTFVSGSQLQAQIPASDIASGASIPVTVSNPSPGGGTSAPTTFSVNNPIPTITSLSPNSATAGGPAFTLTATGTGFTSSSVLQWNGTSRTTAFISNTQLQAQISAADIAATGSASVSVLTPSPGGGLSNTLSFTIGSPGGIAILMVNQLANDLVWDPKQQVIYLSVPSIAGAVTGNTISVLSPSTGNITKSVFAGSEPHVLAISDDSQFLYAGMNGSASVQRFLLPTVTKDISYALGASSFSGPYFALDLQVAPAFPHTTAVTLAVSGFSPAAQGGITIFDDATPRPVIAKGFGPGGGGGVLYDSLQWGNSASALFAANNEDTGFDFYTLTVDSTGVTLNKDYAGAFSSFFIRIHYDPGTKYVYSDDGHIIDPSTGLPVGVFLASGLMVPDSGLNAAFFLGQTQSQFGSRNFTIESFNLTHFTPINSVVVSNVSGYPLHFIRWGTNGLAFNTSGGQVFLLSGTFVSSAFVQLVQPRVLTDHVQRTWEPSKTHALPGSEHPVANP